MDGWEKGTTGRAKCENEFNLVGKRFWCKRHLVSNFLWTGTSYANYIRYCWENFLWSISSHYLHSVKQITFPCCICWNQIDLSFIDSTWNPSWKFSLIDSSATPHFFYFYSFKQQIKTHLYHLSIWLNPESGTAPQTTIRRCVDDTRQSPNQTSAL